MGKCSSFHSQVTSESSSKILIYCCETKKVLRMQEERISCFKPRDQLKNISRNFNFKVFKSIT
jgi:hypothetical protein